MEKELKNKIYEGIEKEIENIMKEGIQVDNVELLGELVDIHKDLSNEDYWEEKKEVLNMRYNNYGDSYGRRSRDSRGRYMDYRGVGAEKMIDEMRMNYRGYSDDKNRYGSKEETMRSLEYMLESVEDFMCMLKEEAGSEEEVRMIRETARKISEM